MAPKPDFNRIWDGAVSFVQGLNGGIDADLRGPGLAASALTLAQSRDAQDGSTTAALYAIGNPEWRIDRGEIDAIEDLAPIIRIDKIDWVHEEFDGSGDNLVQRWRIELMLGIVALGADRDDAIRRFEDVSSVLVNSWLGFNSYMGLNREHTGLERSGLTGGRWATSARGDQYLCSGFKLLRCRARWVYAAP